MTSPAQTLDCRLLCAAVCAYYITPTGRFDPTSAVPYYDAVGFTEAPVPFVGGVSNIDACLVGTNGDGVVLAFRGTLPPAPVTVASLEDWMQDFMADPISVPGIPGKVHEGFWEALQTFWPAVLAEVKRQMSANGQNLPFYISGHSKGGALASLAAMAFHALEAIQTEAVYTYASPLTGDLNFALAYNAVMVDVRYEYTDDIVPHLPPSPFLADLLAIIPGIGPYLKSVAKWDYTAVGTLKFIDWAGNIVGDSIGLELERFKSLFDLMLHLKFEQIANDHDSRCGGGYMTNICPTGVCPVWVPLDKS